MAESNWQRLLEQASKKYARAQYMDILQLCDRAAVCGAEARYAAGLWRGRALLRLHDPAGALSCLDTVADLKKLDPVLDHLRGQALFELGMIPEAEAALRSAIRGDASLHDAYYLLALLAELRGRDGEYDRLMFKARQYGSEKLYPVIKYLSDDAFKTVIEDAVLRLPEDLHHVLVYLVLLVAELPSVKDILNAENKMSPRILASVVSMAKQHPLAAYGNNHRMWMLVLYRKNIQRMFTKTDNLRDGVYQTIEGALSDLSEKIHHGSA